MAVRLPRRVAAPHLRPRTVRLRLTAIYGALFLLCGAGLLAITYVLVEHSTRVFTWMSKDGTTGAVMSGNNPAGLGGRLDMIQRGGTHPAARQTLPDPARMLALAKQQHAQTMHQLLLDSGIALAVMAVLSMGLGWLVAGRVLRPLRTITTAVRDISATNLHRRLAMDGPATSSPRSATPSTACSAGWTPRSRGSGSSSPTPRTSCAPRWPGSGRSARWRSPIPTRASNRCARRTSGCSPPAPSRSGSSSALLALARGQAGLVRSEPVDLADLTGRVLAARAAEIELREVIVDAALEPTAMLGDPRLLESLIANLVDNALRHNVELGRTTVSTATAAGKAVLTVSNSGPVVRPDEVAGLMQPFRRRSPDRGAYADGLGVGLSIVQAVAAAHDAGLDVQAPASGGLRVEVAFAVARTRNAGDVVGTCTDDHAVVSLR